MLFDPTKPATNSPNSSAEMRDQFNGLKTLIDQCATSIDLTNAVQGTSANSNGVGSIAMNADVNYDPNQLQAVINKLDELINALRR